MPNTIFSTFTIQNLCALFRLDEESGRIGLELIPASLTNQQVQPRQDLRGVPEVDSMPFPPNIARAIDPLVHVKFAGEPYTAAFGQGRTMREGSSVNHFRFDEQSVSTQGDATTVLTTLQSAAGHRLEHLLSWHEGDEAIGVQTRFINGSEQPVTLEMLTSFSLGGITPFHEADAPERLQVHRFRSTWSAEGRLCTQSIEELHLERSWVGHGIASERFGQVGSMPVRGWFPFVAVEDVVAGVTWGAQLAWAGSWQMEIFRQHDPVCISGGLADREFGHWTKTLLPGESLETPSATLSCVAGGLDDLCHNLTSVQNRSAELHPAIEADLPIIFNEWCTTWGDPSHEKVVAIAKRLHGSPVKTLVIDAGWYKGETGSWASAQGDWIPSTKLFPEGIEATAAAIREQGLIPGLWFEMETCGIDSAAFHQTDHLLKRDGVPVTTGVRRFWDMTDPYAVEYLSERVIDRLERGGFGYVKVDYNETIGIGAQVAAGRADDSLGEGLRLHIEGVYRFFDLMRKRLPELVIENCSSGGHRLEPSMMARTAMSSFSDAHETTDIPIIAASLHRLLLPRQSQIWAVLHPSDTNQRLIYSLAATFLGRMCLSGDVVGLSQEQWQIAEKAMQAYQQAAPIIRAGRSRIMGDMGPSWRHPRGWQSVVRTSNDEKSALVVLHTFAQTPSQIEIPLPAGNWKVSTQLASKAGEPTIQGNTLICSGLDDFEGRVLLLCAE